jgi:hypothetical protein
MANYIPDVGTSAKPAAVIYPDGKSVFLAWKGEGNDQGIYWTRTQQLAPDAAGGKYTFNPSPQLQAKDAHLNFATSHAPALASFQGRVYMAWKGEEGDDAIYWSYYDGANWQPQTKLQAATKIAPAMVATGDTIFLVSKGQSDNNIWWAMMGDSFDGGFTELGPIKVANTIFQTSATPALTVDGNTVYMAWKGGSTDNLYWAECKQDLQSFTEGGILPVSGGLSAWGNYQWGTQQSIPAYQGAFSGPGGAGPAVTGPALVFIKGSKGSSSGLYIAWVVIPSNSAEWGPGFSLGVSFLPQNSATWISSGYTAEMPVVDGQPTFIPVFPPNSQIGTVSPIYFYEGPGDDWNIYYDSIPIPIPVSSGGFTLVNSGASSGTNNESGPTSPTHGAGR